MEPVSDIWVFLQVLARVSALVAVAPVFGASQVPAQVKVGLALLISCAIFPLERTTALSHGMPSNMFDLMLVIGLQAMVGLLLGIVASLVLSAIALAGSFLDLQIGFTLAQTFNPTLGELVSPIAQLQYLYSMLIFLLANGHFMLLAALVKSFDALPAGSLGATSAGLQFFSDLTFAILVNGVRIALPVGAVLFCVDVSFALMSRAVPQMNVFFVGMPLKAVLGISLVGVALPTIAVLCGHVVAQMSSSLVGGMTAFHR